MTTGAAMNGTERGTLRSSRSEATTMIPVITTMAVTRAQTSSNDPKLHRPPYRPRIAPHTTNTTAAPAANVTSGATRGGGMANSYRSAPAMRTDTNITVASATTWI